MRADILCMGELLVDFVALEAEPSLDRVEAFGRFAGGAPANVAVGLARLGLDVGFLGKVGRDPFGTFLVSTLDAEGVDTSLLKRTPLGRTTLAFVTLTEGGERDFFFYRDSGADALLSADEIPEAELQGVKILHYGSVILSQGPAREAARVAVRRARERGVLTSFDPNLRLSLWSAPEEAAREIEVSIREADIVKLNMEELQFLTGTTDMKEGLRQLWTKFRPSVLVLSLGKDGCFTMCEGEGTFVDGYSVDSVDTTGAGDAFMSGLLCGISRTVDEGIDLEKIDGMRLRNMLRFANACGAICTLKRGAMTTLPAMQDVVEFLENCAR